MNQDELIIDYTKSEEKSPRYYHQLLFTVLISNIADILFRCVVGSFGFFAFESVNALIITRIVLSFLALGLMITSTIWVFKVISKIVGESTLLSITLSVSLAYVVSLFLYNCSDNLITLYLNAAIENEELIFGTIADTVLAANILSMIINVLYRILFIASIVLRLFVLIKNKVLHRLLAIALILPGIIYFISIPVSVIAPYVINFLRDPEKPSILSQIYHIISFSFSQLVAMIVDIIYICYLSFAMKKTKETTRLGDGLALGFMLYAASCILTFLVISIISIVLYFI